MLLKKIIIGSYEIDPIVLMDDRIHTIDTAISYNNDSFIPSDPNIKIISKMNTELAEQYDFFMDNHLKYLDRDHIDIMLVHNNQDKEKAYALYDRLLNDDRVKEVGISNFDEDDLYYLSKKYNPKDYPKYHEMEVNPEFTDIKLIELTKELGIKVIGYAIFGGKYKAKEMIENYGLNELLAYANEHCDLFIYRPDTKEQLDEVGNIRKFEENIIKPPKINDKSIVPYTYKIPENATTLDNLINEGWSATKVVLDDTMLDLKWMSDFKVYYRYLHKLVQVDFNDLYCHDDSTFRRIELIHKDGRITKVKTDEDEVYVLTKTDES